MIYKNSVILVGSGKLSQQKLSHALSQAGFSPQETTFQDIALALKATPTCDLLLFNLEDIKDPSVFERCNKLAATIKANPETDQVHILSIGISPEFMLEPCAHSFNDLIFGPVRLPSVISRIKALARLSTMKVEMKRRHLMNEKYGLHSNFENAQPPSIEGASVLVTGRPNGYSRIEQTLSSKVTLVGALTQSAAKDYLERQSFDMLIINGGRTPTRFLDFVEQVRKNAGFYNLPILLAAHPSKLSNSHIAYETGFTDIIEAPVNKNELILRVNALIQEHRFRQLMAKPYLEARHVPSNDALTGLYTFSYYREHLAALIKDHTVRERKFTLITICIDNIEAINQSYGFIAGDQVLRQVAEILMSINRGEDLLSRISGRKFVVTLPNTLAKQAVHLVQRIEGILKQTKFMCDTDCSPITVSLTAEITESNGEDTAAEFLGRQARAQEKNDNPHAA